MTTTPPGGWYQDPSGPPGLQRWWDGTTWTNHTQVAMAPPPLPPAQSGPPLVSYGRRLGGWLIDWLIVGVVSTIVIAATGTYHHTNTTTSFNGSTSHTVGFHIGGPGILIQAGIALVYGMVLCGSKRGQTVGMMAVGVRAVDIRSGESIGYARALWRAFFEYLMAAVLLIPWVIDMLFPLWDPMRQCLHDKVSRTIVIQADASWHPGAANSFPPHS
jgi:uncharacterized RDD family membrane protein YckC